MGSKSSGDSRDNQGTGGTGQDQGTVEYPPVVFGAIPGVDSEPYGAPLYEDGFYDYAVLDLGGVSRSDCEQALSHYAADGFRVVHVTPSDRFIMERYEN